MAKSLKQLSTYTYVVNGVHNFTLTDYMRAMKTKFDVFELYDKNNPQEFKTLKSFVKENWDSLTPFTFQECLKRDNVEQRRVLFSCLNPASYFTQIQNDLQLVDREVLIKQNQKWDKNNKPYTETIEDVYELYSIPYGLLMKVKREWSDPENIYLVRCWCTSTKREYWLFVGEQAFRQYDYKIRDYTHSKKAIDAIAWTFRIGIKWEAVKNIKRQGDLLVVEAVDPTVKILPNDRWYHLTAAQYKEKLVAES